MLIQSRDLGSGPKCTFLPVGWRALGPILLKTVHELTLTCELGDIKKAKEAGYHTCESLLMNTRKAIIHHEALVSFAC